ncbi:two-component sensor histidine kinase [Fulvivirga imtechensis AK7]|uniref:histidine kinase n=1 Tax=Fulvivirga imtechensis AK7 TaxID=1237149 RepID=L8JW80_9BACT|nr:HAMP domain-containing sensor histidine kinase [Fulvivirga imtechensis]ELR72458.1 two-component sensor histidine kinase [Fulvivirga imtechensis AK7]
MRTPLSIKEMNLLLNRELSEANTVLDKFVYSCSHDLKGPLASIKGLIRLAEKSSRNDVTDECLHLINESVVRMDNFIKSLESFVANARGPVLKNEVDLLGIINRILEERVEHAKIHKIKLRVRVKQMQKFYSDDARLNVILHNLIENAINYQDMKKTEKFVDIEVKVSTEQAQIEICDNGEGIAKEAMSDIFKMFYRSSEASRGSGLGLYIVQEAVTKLRGEISVASSKGVGSNFVVKIPNTK